MIGIGRNAEAGVEAAFTQDIWIGAVAIETLILGVIDTIR